MSISKFFKEAVQWKLSGGPKAAGLPYYVTDTNNNVVALGGAGNKTYGLPTGVHFSAYGPLGGGAATDSPKLVQAFLDAYTAGLPLIMPAGTFLLSRPIKNLVSIIGIPGKTSIIIDNTFVRDATMYGAGQFIFQNPNFGTSYNNSTADSIYMYGINVVITPGTSGSLFGFGNVANLKIINCTATAQSAMNAATGLPYPIDSLYDLYACVNNAEIAGCTLSNLTCARGTSNSFTGSIASNVLAVTSLSSSAVGNQLTTGQAITGAGIAPGTVLGTIISGVATGNSTWNITHANVGAVTMYSSLPWNGGGGGAIWIRNFLSGSATQANATQNIDIHDNIVYHQTTDETIAAYACYGITNNVKIHHNTIYGLAPSTVDASHLTYHTGLVTAFPLTLGVGAAIFDIQISDNQIYDFSWWSSILRFGNSGDTAQCYNLKSANNQIFSGLPSSGAYYPHTVWTTYGSIGGDPNLNSFAIRAVGNSYLTFSGFSYAGFSSTNDTLQVTGAQAFMGFSGFDVVVAPQTRGNVWYGVSSCVSVTGGNIEAVAVGYENCNSVTGGSVKLNYAVNSSCAILIDSNAGGTYNATGVMVSAGGNGAGNPGANLLNVSSSVNTSATKVSVTNCNVSMNAGTNYAMVNNSTNATIYAFNNIVTNGQAGAGNKSGTITTANNYYNGVVF